MHGIGPPQACASKTQPAQRVHTPQTVLQNMRKEKIYSGETAEGDSGRWTHTPPPRTLSK